MSVKKRIWDVITTTDSGDRASRVFAVFIPTLIILNIIAVVLESEKQIFTVFPRMFRNFEIFSVIIFSLEYALRVWLCTTTSQYARPFLGRVRFILTPMMLIDLLAIAPFYMMIGIDLRSLRILRLFRLFRIAKLARYSKALQTLGRVFRSKREELLLAVFVLFIMIVISSAMMYFVERDIQPDAFGSIPQAMWWSVGTLTTVGYGEVRPVTILGKILGAIIAVLGIAIFALPTAILGSGFVEELQQKTPTRCPHCGRSLK